MRRFVPVAVAAVWLTACEQDRTTPTSPADLPVTTAISDGAHGGNSFFYFLPPIVESPLFTGIFNPELRPSVEICELENVGVPSVEPSCIVGPPQDVFSPAEITVSLENEHYKLTWHTDDSNLLASKYYRIEVLIGETLLGFRDLDPADSPNEVPSNPETLDFYAFLNGSTIPVKFRIEEGALCSGDAVSCGECSLTTSEGGVCNADAGLGTFVAANSLPEDVTVILERLECPRDGEGRVTFFPFIDIPQFGGCFSARTEPPLDEPINPGAIVGVCVEQPTGLSADQEARLHIHRSEDRNDPDEPVEALPNVAADFLDCDAFAEAQLSPPLRYARRGWRALKQVLPLGATPAYATHVGFGGKTIDYSHFGWALPSQMQILEGDGQTALVGTAVATDPAVLVTDEAGDPVQNARVTYAVTSGGGSVDPTTPIYTGSDGIARVNSWILGPTVGLNTLEASGYGIGVAPPDGSGPFVTADLPPAQLDTGRVEFTATACSAGFGTPSAIDGSFSDGEWDCALTQDFSANLSGGSGTPATLFWMNDHQNLYLAVRVQRSEADKVNTLSVNFDNTGDGASLGDDVLEMDGDAQQFSDLFLTSKCLKKGQSGCGDPDTSDGGTEDGTGAFANDGTYTIYEISHPLASGDWSHDYQVISGDVLRLWIALRLGNGAQGNTEFPGFQQYLSITIQ